MNKTGAQICILFCVFAISTAPALGQSVSPDDPIRTLVQRLDLEKYKATIKGLTQFGDRRQGTARNRAAIDWIEAQLKSYGCTNTERLKYTFGVEPPHAVAPPPADSKEVKFNVGGARARGIPRQTGVNYDCTPSEPMRQNWGFS